MLVRKNPAETQRVPMRAQIFGPFLSWIRPAMMNDSANTTTAIVYVRDVWARFQPNSLSSGATKTLHAYSDPSARFINTPPATTRHRFIYASPAIDDEPGHGLDPPGS